MRLVTRISVLLVGVLIWPIFVVSAGAESEQGRPIFFIATAERAIVADHTIALGGRTTLSWVTDRPFRQSGSMPVTKFTEGWSKGADDLAKDPPNAVITGNVGERIVTAVIELAHPRTIDGDLMFDFTLLDGALSGELTGVSLFIDDMRQGGAGGFSG